MNKNKLAAAVLALLVTTGTAAPVVPFRNSSLATAAAVEDQCTVFTDTSQIDANFKEVASEEELLSGTYRVYEDNCEYLITDGFAIFENAPIIMPRKFTVPETVDGVPVRAIGDGAFAMCIDLEELTLPDTIEAIGARAFTDLKYLSVINMPETLNNFGANAFFGTAWLADLMKYCEDGDYAVYNNVLIDGSKCYGDVTIQNGVYKIAPYAFSGNDNITHITAGNGVDEIGEYAFANCSNLHTVDIDFASHIRLGAFMNCPKLRNVTIQNPECRIEDPMTICNESGPVPVYTGTISSVPGYDVEEYAKKWGYSFNDMKAGCYQEYDENGIVYHIYGPYAVVAKVLDTDAENIEIPDMICDVPVVAVDDYAFYQCGNIRNVILSESVESIGRYAFAQCGGLEAVKMYGVKEIGYGAFSQCVNMTDIRMSECLEYVGDCAFQNCEKLSWISLPDTTTYIGSRAFMDCFKLSEIILSDNLRKICDETFMHCATAQIHFRSNNTVLESIGARAFDNCASMTEFVIPDSVTYIGEEAFKACVALEKIIVPGSVEKIEKNAFNTCLALRYVELQNGVYSVGEGAFLNDVAIEELYLPESLRFIDNSAFQNCRGLTVIDIPDGVYSIGKRAFAYCCGVVKMHIPSSVYSIGEAAFDNLPEIEEIFIPKGVKQIEVSAFANCPGLKDIYFYDPETVIAYSNTTVCTNSEENGFYSEHGYTNGFFTGTIHGYAPSTAADYASFFNYNFEPIPTSPEVVSSEGFSFSVIGDTAILDDVDIAMSGDVVVPFEFNGIPVKYIGDYAFAQCKDITSVTLPDSIVAIDEFAFADDTSLKYVKIPDSVKYIGNHAFANCYKLEKFNIPASLSCIEEGTFENCDSITEAIIPENVQTIERDAFRNCHSLINFVVENPFCFMPYDKQVVCTDTLRGLPYFDGTIRAAEGSRAQKYAAWAGWSFETSGEKTEVGVSGDANLDKDITLADSLAVLQFVANSSKYALPDIAVDNADVYMRGDGITALDAVSIQKFDLHMIKELPESWQKGDKLIK